MAQEFGQFESYADQNRRTWREQQRAFKDNLATAPERELTPQEFALIENIAQEFGAAHPAAFANPQYSEYNGMVIAKFQEERNILPTSKSLEAIFHHVAPDSLYLTDFVTGKVYSPGTVERDADSETFKRLMSPVQQREELDYADLSADELKAHIEQTNPAPLPELIRREREGAYEGWLKARPAYFRNNSEQYEEVRNVIFDWIKQNELLFTFQTFDAAAKALVSDGKLLEGDESWNGVHRIPGFTYVQPPRQSRMKEIHDRRPVEIEEDKPRKYTRSGIDKMTADEYQNALMNDPLFAEAVNQMGQS